MDNINKWLNIKDVTLLPKQPVFKTLSYKAPDNDIPDDQRLQLQIASLLRQE